MSETVPTYTTSAVHYYVVNGHIQDTAPNWPAGVASFPPNTYVEIFQVEMVQEISPSQHPIFRKYLAHQQPLLFAADKKKAADDWIKTWCDATFMQYADRVWGVCDLNEFFSNGDTPYDREHKIGWAIAFLEVWNDWRARTGLEHIIAVSSRTAVGNDIPIEVAEACQLYGAALSYHPYWPVQNGVIFGEGSNVKGFAGAAYSAIKNTMRDGGDYIIKASYVEGRATSSDSARWFHQRWQAMDDYYKSNGITVPYWVSTEIGAVGYSQSPNGDLHLHPNDGWRHPNVYNGNLPAFIDSLKSWSQSVAEWNAQNNNRFLGGQIFTTNREANGWHDYRVTGDQLVTIGNAMSAWQPDITPPPIDEWQRFVDSANNSQTIAQMKGTALQEAIMGHGLQMLGNEYIFTYDNGSDWVCRLAGNGDGNDSRWVYRFPIGNYDPSALVIDEVRKE